MTLNGAAKHQMARIAAASRADRRAAAAPRVGRVARRRWATAGALPGLADRVVASVSLAPMPASATSTARDPIEHVLGLQAGQSRVLWPELLPNQSRRSAGLDVVAERLQQSSRLLDCGDAVRRAGSIRSNAHHIFKTSSTAVAMNNRTKTPMAIRPARAAGVSLWRGRASGSDRPEVCDESGGVDPGATPPPGSRPGVLAGSGSGGRAVTVRNDLYGVRCCARSTRRACGR